MESIFKLLHLLSFSVLYGTSIFLIFNKHKKIHPIMRLAGGLTVLSGVVLVILKGVEEGFDHILNLMFLIKMVLVLIAGGWAFIRKNDNLNQKEIIFHALLLTLVIMIASLFL